LAQILASLVHWDKEASESERYDDTLAQIFASSGWISVREQRKSKLELKSGANVYCIGEAMTRGQAEIPYCTPSFPIPVPSRQRLTCKAACTWRW